ncbi:hypothetical protein ACFSR6_20710 [Pedobacter vanadiisoli]|uniref:Uncharacterized protein n=1 Tax=Pedobacter vanadiisoli TaxID=1761975 RepID=A0ABW5MQ43_9SPHI
MVTQFSDTKLITPSNIGYLQSIIILCLLVYLIIVLKNKKSKEKELAFMKSEVANTTWKKTQLNTELEDLKIKNAKLEEEMSIHRLKEETLLKEFVPEEQNNVNTIEWQIDKPKVVRQPERFYTKYADLIDGFSVAELVEDENNETIFEIRLQSPNKATFKVNENPAAQKYALTNADYFLQKTCVYDVVPFGKITTEKEGQLSLSGGKWEIIEPAKISFK